MERKKLLGAIFVLNLKMERATADAIARQLGSDEKEVRTELEKLSGSGHLDVSRGAAYLTAKGRKSIRVVFLGGGFEVIHHGHLHTIEKARSHGDVLVVAVATDNTIRRRKKREPVAGQEERARLLSSLRQVDVALVGSEGDIYVTLERVKPDIVALGYDQYHREDDIVREATKRGFNVRVVRLDAPDPTVKTSSLVADY